MKSFGISSLLVVFIVLFLVTFTAISLSSAKSDYNFSVKAADHKEGYYTACNLAETTLNSIRTGRVSISETGAAVDGNKAEWLIEINRQQALNIEATIVPNENDGYDYEINKWNVVSTVKRDYNQKLNLLRQ